LLFWLFWGEQKTFYTIYNNFKIDIKNNLNLRSLKFNIIHIILLFKVFWGEQKTFYTVDNNFKIDIKNNLNLRSLKFNIIPIYIYIAIKFDLIYYLDQKLVSHISDLQCKMLNW
jgi:uncharacterized protein YybS (DUF2232 family)